MIPFVILHVSFFVVSRKTKLGDVFMVLPILVTFGRFRPDMGCNFGDRPYIT